MSSQDAKTTRASNVPTEVVKNPKAKEQEEEQHGEHTVQIGKETSFGNNRQADQPVEERKRKRSPEDDCLIDEKLYAIQALLCGSITQYIILYGTAHQSNCAQEMQDNIEKSMSDANSKIDFAIQLQKIYNFAGHYLWTHAFNHFQVSVLPECGSKLDLEEGDLEKATNFLKMNTLDDGALDFSLADYSDRIKIPLQRDIFKHDSSFDNKD